MNYHALILKYSDLPINIITSITGYLQNDKEQYDKVIYSLKRKFINDIINKKSYVLKEDIYTNDTTYSFFWFLILLRYTPVRMLNYYGNDRLSGINNTQILRELCFFNNIDVKKSYSKKKMVSLLLKIN